MRHFFLERKKILSEAPALTGPDVKHLRTVLRLKPGDEIFLFDGEGSEYRARITTSTPTAIALSILEQFPSIPESHAEITVGQGLLRAEKMARVVRQVTELGIHALIPVRTERSTAKPTPRDWAHKEQRWAAISRESLKQCGRSQPLHIEPVNSFKELVATARAYSEKVIFHESGSRLKSSLYSTDPGDASRVLALVGPEGGFTPEEIQAAMKCGFVCVSLGQRVLKADTAVVAACAVLQYTFGDLGDPEEKP
jgi:16S rRNA (uracil1498-N3)-methyltransferase